MIKYILWDIDGTLLDFSLAEEKALGDCFKNYGLGVLNTDMLNSYRKINKSHWEQYERGEINKETLMLGRFSKFFELYKINIGNLSDFNLDFQTLLGRVGVYTKDAEDLVKFFNKSYRQFGATNGSKIAQEGKLNNSGLDKLLERVFISEDLGVDKPNPEFFHYIFDYTGDWDLDTYIIVGDSLTSDIQGGNNVGIKTCWYNPKGHIYRGPLTIDYEIKSLKDLLNIL